MDFKFNEDTICAIATPVGEGGIGIIRITGLEALLIAHQLFLPRQAAPSLQSHQLYCGWIIDPASREPVDEVLLSYMAAPRTYTREDVVEINCHSGYAVLRRILDLVLQAGARLAEPGEFTRRAFCNGRIDLSQAEAVLDIIHSRSQRSLAAANRHLRGDLRNTIENWREQVLRVESEIEASIDFAEDVTDETGNPERLAEFLENKLITPLKEMSSQYEKGRILREGLTLVLVGKPNVGKSSLLNALLQKDRAIVTPYPGTTRDVIEDSFILSGVEVRILDTAGIRLQPDSIESLGIERTLRSVDGADVVLWLIDQSRPLSAADDAVFQALADSRCVILLNKSDLPAVTSPEAVRERYKTAANTLRLSVYSAPDIEALQHYLSETFLKTPLQTSGSALIPNLRHSECLRRAASALSRASQLLRDNGYAELVSLELQAAKKQLDSIMGVEADDDLLDRIFSRFCIGK